MRTSPSRWPEDTRMCGWATVPKEALSRRGRTEAAGSQTPVQELDIWFTGFWWFGFPAQTYRELIKKLSECSGGASTEEVQKEFESTCAHESSWTTNTRTSQTQHARLRRGMKPFPSTQTSSAVLRITDVHETNMDEQFKCLQKRQKAAAAHDVHESTFRHFGPPYILETEWYFKSRAPDGFTASDDGAGASGKQTGGISKQTLVLFKILWALCRHFYRLRICWRKQVGFRVSLLLSEL